MATVEIPIEAANLSIPANPYILLTPGPLSTSPGVRGAMLRDWCTWDDDYNVGVVEVIRSALVKLASPSPGYTCALMQGSGTFSVEAAVTSMVPADGTLLVLANGAYGDRIAKISRQARIDTVVHDSGETRRPDLEQLAATLRADAGITHVAVVHGETTTGMLNPIEDIGRVVKAEGRTFLVDAMSTFGGVPIDMEAIGIDFLVSSANKCIQGVPGFGFILATTAAMASCQGRARSLSLDLYDQWRTMEDNHGKWRFTSPTHTVRAFAHALGELDEEGGIAKRHARYRENHRILVDGMARLGFDCLLPREWQSPIITAFRSPTAEGYRFRSFYDRLKALGFVIYPGKVTDIDTFRIGTIGHVFPDDMYRLIDAVQRSMDW